MPLINVDRAQSLEEALRLLANQNDDLAMIIAGGTDLITRLREKRGVPNRLIDISNLPELQYIRDNSDVIEIGAATVFAKIAGHSLINKYASGLQTAARGVGSPQIRNRGTIGGNICNGSPAADTVPPLLALDATVVFQDLTSKREAALAAIHKDKGQVDIRSGEILTQVRFNKLTTNQGLGFCKLGLRKALAISTISLSIFLEIDQQRSCKVIRIASGSLARSPQREYKMEKYLHGKLLNEKTINAAAAEFNQELLTRLADRPPVELAYKPEAIKGVFKSALGEAMAEAAIPRT